MREFLPIDYQLLIEHIPAITYIAAWDEHSSTLYVSPQIEQLLGFSQSEWMADAHLWLKQIHPDDRDVVVQELQRIHAGGTPHPCDYRMLTRTGQVRWFHDDAAIRSDENNRPLCIYGVMIDITKQKEMEAELSTTQRQLWEARKPCLDERALAVLQLLQARYTDREIG